MTLLNHSVGTFFFMKQMLSCRRHCSSSVFSSLKVDVLTDGSIQSGLGRSIVKDDSNHVISRPGENRESGLTRGSE